MNFDLLKKLCFSFGVSGGEKEIADAIIDEISEVADEVKTDRFGNVYASYKSGENLPTVVLDAHMDSVGFVISETCENGFLKFQSVGGVDPNVLPGTEVTVNGKTGVIASKPPHLMTDKDRERPLSIGDMHVDTGYLKESSNIKKGDLVSYKPYLEKMGNSVTGTYLDDRIGCCIIIELFKKLRGRKLPFNLIGIFTKQEEIGLVGAKFFENTADLCIVIDVTHGKTPDEKSDESFYCGKGCTLGVGPNSSPYYNKVIEELCVKNDIPYQTEVLEGNSGTNAWRYQVSGNGLPCVILSIPLKFMHTPVETVSVFDIENAEDILTEFLLNMGDKYEFISNIKSLKQEINNEF